MAIDYTKLRKKLNPEPGGEDVLRLRVGVVAAVNADGTVDITLSGVTVPSVPVLESAVVEVGTPVQILSYRGSLMVIGGTTGAGASRLVARGRRTTPTGNITTTEVGVLRIDNIPVFEGKGYEITTSPLNIDTVDPGAVNQVGVARIRISTAGAATISSTQIGHMRNTIDNIVLSNVIPLQTYYFPPADATLSVLLSAARVAGGDPIILFASGTEILDMVVREIGTDPGDTGVVI